MTFKKFITYFFVIAILLAVAIFGIFYYLKSQNAKNLDVSLVLPDKVQIGIPFEATVSISNNSGSVLNGVDLTINLPEGIAFSGKTPDRLFSNKILGNLGSGSLIDENFKFIALSGENTVKEINAKVSYVPEGLNSRFEKGAVKDLVINPSVLAIDLIIPEKVYQGSDLNFEIHYKNNASVDLSNLRVSLEYPQGFKYQSASLNPDFTLKSWQVGDLRSGSSGNLKIKGSFAGLEGNSSDIDVKVFGLFDSEYYLIAEKNSSIAVEKSPLSIALSLQNKNDYVKLGDQLHYILDYKNNTEIPLNDIIVRAKLSGAMFDLTKISGNGNLNSSSDTVIWNASFEPNLASLAPQQSGKLNLYIKLKDSYPIKRINDKNFTLKIDAQIESPTVPLSVSANKILGLSSLETKVLGQVVLAVRGYFRDANSGFLNSGELPLISGRSTDFTVHWLIYNYANDLRDVKVSSLLGPNVRLKNSKTNIPGVDVSYDERTQEVSWQIPKVQANRGVVTGPYEAVLQLTAVPSVAQVGQGMLLLKQSDLSGVDDFTNSEVQTHDSEIRTTSLNDPTVTSQDGNVVR